MQTTAPDLSMMQQGLDGRTQQDARCRSSRRSLAGGGRRSDGGDSPRASRTLGCSITPVAGLHTDYADALILHSSHH